MKLPYDEWNDELNRVRPPSNWPLAIVGLLAFLGVCGFVWWRF